ncbi:MAG TPA: hypothetical protein VNQ76_07465 [Planctomicrobium sp.]|nr:hypothetical protein [Planctomicrobium sp.]
MISRRRLTLQLTPLLDMLLIVVFLQYFQLRDREQSLAGDQQAIVTEREETQSQISDLVQRIDSLREQLSVTESQATQVRDIAIQDRQRLVQSQSSLSLVLEQQKIIGQLVHELFQIPAEEVNQLLNSARGPGDARTPAERERVMQRFRQLASQSPGRMLEHLLSYEEIRKRCDVWNLHIDADGVATISDSIRSRRIRIPMQDDGEVLSEQFIGELFAWYRTLPQPKSLVVILLTYDRDTRIYVTESVRSALPIWVSRMQFDSAGRSRFEYADLGFRIQ